MKPFEHIVLKFETDEDAFERATRDYRRVGTKGVAGSSDFTIEWDSELLDDLESLSDDKAVFETLEQTGQRLAEILEPADWKQDAGAIAEALDADRRVVVTFCAGPNAEELYGLPWSTLAVDRHATLGSNPDVLLHYTRPRSTEAQPRPLGDVDGRVLLAWSSAGGEVPNETHEASVQAACDVAGVDLHVHGKVSLDGLRETLEQARSQGRPFQILHLLCHGTLLSDRKSWGLALDAGGPDSPSDIHPTNANKLAAVLQAGGAELQLVVLSACNSAARGDLGSPVGSVAEAIHETSGRAVVASQFPLSAKGSNALTRTLYDRLLVHLDSLEDAFVAALADVGAHGVDLDRYSLQLFSEMDGLFDHRPIPLCPPGGPMGARPGDGRFVYQRDEDIERLLHAYDGLPDDRRVLFVTGEVGAGKSTVVLSGLVPRLLERDGGVRQVRWFNPGANPMAELAACRIDLDEGRPALIVVDQLEEVFTHVEKEAARIEFLRELHELVTSPEHAVTAVATLCDDFAVRVAQQELDEQGRRLGFAAADTHRVHVPTLDKNPLKRVARDALGRLGLTLDGGVLDALGEEHVRSSDALHQLSFATARLWEERGERRRLRVDDYRGLCRGKPLVGIRADSVLGELPRSEAEEALGLLAAIAGRGKRGLGQGRPWLLVRHVLPAAVDRHDAFFGALRALLDSRLLVLRESSKGRRIQLGNRLLESRWRTLSDRRLEEGPKNEALRRLQGSLDELDSEGGVLLGPELDHARTCIDQYRDALSDRSLRAVLASINHHQDEALKIENARSARAERRARTSRWLAIAGCAVALLVSGLAGVSIHSCNRAESETIRAESRAREARDTVRMLHVERHPLDRDGRAQLLRGVEQPETTPGWMRAVYELLADPVPLATYRFQSSVRDMHLFDDGRTLARTKTGDVFLLPADREAAEIALRVDTGSTQAESMAVSPDRDEVVLGRRDGWLSVHSLSNPTRSGELLGEPGKPVHSIHYVGDGRLLVLDRDGIPSFVPRDGSVPRPLCSKCAGFDAASIEARPPHRIALGDAEGRVRAWTAEGMEIPSGGDTAAADGVVGRVKFVHLLRDGSTLLVVDDSGALRQQPVGLVEGRAPDPPGGIAQRESTFLAAALSPDERWLVRTWNKGPSNGAPPAWVTITDLHEGGETKPLPGHTDMVVGVAFDGASARLATASHDGTARVWERKESGWSIGTVLQNQTAGEDGRDQGHLLGVAASPDGRLLALSGKDETVTLWSSTWAPRGVAKWQVERPTEGASPRSVSFDAAGERALVRWTKQKVGLYEPSERVPTVRSMNTRSIVYTGSEDKLAVVTKGGHLRFGTWPLDDLEEGEGDGPWVDVWCTTAHDSCVAQQTRNHLFVVDEDGTEDEIPGSEQGGPTLRTVLDPRSEGALALRSNNVLEFSLVESDTPGRKVCVQEGQACSPADAAAYLAGDGAVALARRDGSIDVRSSRESSWSSFDRPRLLERAAAIDIDTKVTAMHGIGQRWITGGRDGWVRIWDPTGEESVALPPPVAGGIAALDEDGLPEVLGLAVRTTPEGHEQVVSFSDDLTFRTWTLEPAALLVQLEGLATRPRDDLYDPEAMDCHDEDEP
jgi:WD40 repeat protein